MNAVSLVPSERALSVELQELYLAATVLTVAELKPDEMLEGRIAAQGYKEDHLISMGIAVRALQAFNATTFTGEDGEGFLQLASIALPDCLAEDEANFLSVEGLLDCSNPGEGFSAGVKMCPGTCGFNLAGLFYSQMVAKIYFLLFVCISQFVLLQLVIAVLMDQLSNAGGADAAKQVNKAPGCE